MGTIIVLVAQVRQVFRYLSTHQWPPAHDAVVIVFCAERMVATLRNIGPAVFNGGFSTFLAFVLLANSSSYGFVVFFRVRQARATFFSLAFLVF